MRKTALLPRLYGLLLFIYALLCSWRPLSPGYDFWAHAAAGRWMWSNGRLPAENLFLWSAPGFPWVAHSWLSELIFYFCVELGGPLSVILLTSCCAVLSFALIWGFWKSRAPINFIAPLLLLLGIFASLPRFQPRQEMLTALILTGLLIYLARWRDDNIASADRPGHYWWAAIGMVALFALWINLHALAATGLLLLLGTACCDALQYRFDKRSRVLLAIWAGCAAATLANPYGIHYWQAAEQLRPGNQSSYITEWKPFWYPQPVPFKFVYAEAALLLAAMFAWFRGTERRWAQLFWLILMTALMLRSRRMLWLAALTYLVVAAANARSFESASLWQWYQRLMKRNPQAAIPAPLQRLTRAAVLTVLILSAVQGARLAAAFNDGAWPPRLLARDTPVKISRLIKDRNLPGRLFNDYETSTYLQWALNGPDPVTGRVSAAGLHPLYIDLLNAFPDAVMFSYLDALRADPRGVGLFDDRKVNTIYMGPEHQGDALIAWLDRSPAWRALARGEEGFLWVRRKPLQ